MTRRRGFPFAVALTVLIAAIATATGAWSRRISPHILEEFGYSTQDLWSGRPWTLVTSIFLTSRPAMSWIIMVFAPLSIGLYEWLAGTRRAMIVFFAGDVLATLLLSLLVILPLYLAGLHAGAQWALERDVGMSAGGFAVVGASIALAPQRWRLLLLGGVCALVAVKMVIAAEPVADLVHVFGLILGFTGQLWFGRKTMAA